MTLYKIPTEALVEELKARFDVACFVGERRLTKDKIEPMIRWQGEDHKRISGMLFDAAYTVTHTLKNK